MINIKVISTFGVVFRSHLDVNVNGRHFPQLFSDNLVYWIIPMVGLSAIYLLTMSQNHTVAEDALAYVVDINTGFSSKLFHPNHLLFNFICWFVFEVCKIVRYSDNAAPIVHAINALSGAFCVTMLFNIARLTFGDRKLAAVVAASLAFSSAFWVYTVETDTYVLPIVFVLLALRFFLARLHIPGVRAVIPVSLCLIVATLIHQQHVFTFVAFAIAYYAVDSGQLLARCKKGAVLLISGGVSILAVYAIIGLSIIGFSSLSDFINWSMGHASGGNLDPPSVTSPINAVIGLIRSIFALDVLFAFDWFNSLVTQAFPNKLLVEERYTAIRTPMASVVIAITSLVAALIAATWLIGRAVSEAYRKSSIESSQLIRTTTRESALSIICVAYISVHGIAVTIWEPTNPEFWIPVLPILYLGCGMVLVRLGLVELRLHAAIFVLALGASTFFGTILPQTDRSTDFWYMSSQELFNELRPCDVLITESAAIGNSYAAYYGGPEVVVVSVAKTPLSEIYRIIDERPCRVLISSWAITPPSAVLTRDRFQSWDSRAMRNLMTFYEPEMELLLGTESQTVWVLN